MKQKFKKSLIAAAIAVSAFGISISQEALQTPAIEIPDPVATIKGQPLEKAEFMEFINFLTNGNQSMLQSTQQVESLVEAYILQKTLAAKAIEEKLDQTPAFENQMKQIKTAALAELFITDYTSKIKITDDELKAEYDRQIASVDKDEYKAAHILVETKEEADNVLKLLAEGKVFADVAKEFSTDSGSAVSGGDLGWFSAGMMVPEFSGALKTMKKGEVSKEPIKSQFGFHIISLEDTRPVAVESFDSLKESLTGILSEQKLRAYIDGVSKELVIEYKTVATPEKPDDKKEADKK